MASSTEKFAIARSRILAEFASLGWMVSNPNLKVPHATSLDRRHRFWLKPQAVYYSFGSNANDMHAAHSVTMDMRGWTADRLIRVVEPWVSHGPRENPRRSSGKQMAGRRRLANPLDKASLDAIKYLNGNIDYLVERISEGGSWNRRDGYFQRYTSKEIQHMRDRIVEIEARIADIRAGRIPNPSRRRR